MEAKYRSAVTDWLASASGIDRMARAQLEDVAARLTFADDDDGDGLGPSRLEPPLVQSGGVRRLVQRWEQAGDRG